jgi:dihydropteroate synthase
MGFINRQLFPGFWIGDFHKPIVMGVINLSPESFYKGSVYSKSTIIPLILDFIANGAKILDFGARSTAPGVTPISIEEEKTRLLNALELIQKSLPADIILSIDTQYSEIAELCLQYASHANIRMIINDVSSFQTDPLMIETIIKFNCPVIIMASNTCPGDTCTIEDVLKAINRTIEQLKKKGYDLSKLIIDPGVGKWVTEKTYEYDLAILDNLSSLRCFGVPILVGLSRKSFLGTLLDEKDPLKRDIGSYAATSIAVYNGAHIIRTHDVNLIMNQTIQTAAAIRKKPCIIQKNAQKCELIGTFSDVNSAYFFLRQYGITPAGSRIMKDKMVTKIVVLHGITAPQLLARGGDVGLHSQVITTEWKKNDEIFDIVLIATIKQYKNLIQKLRGQQLKLDLIAHLIEEALFSDMKVIQWYHK